MADSLSQPYHADPNTPQGGVDSFRQFTMWVLAEYDKRIAEMHVGFATLVQVQQDLANLHEEHEAKMDMMLAILHALNDLVRARRN